MVDELYVTDVRVLLRYWKTSPPIHLVLSGLLSAPRPIEHTPSPIGDVRHFVDEFKQMQGMTRRP